MSPNYKGIIAIVAHWTSSEYKVEKALLAIREVEGAHTGRNISATLFDVIEEFNIVYKLGYFMTDNASNNDKALKWLNKYIKVEGGAGFKVEEC